MLNISLYSVGGAELKLPPVSTSMSGGDLICLATELNQPLPEGFACIVRLLVGGTLLQQEKTLQDQGVMDGQVVTYAIREVSEQEQMAANLKLNASDNGG